MRFNTLIEANYGSLIDQGKYDDLDPADQALYKYTADGFTSLGSHIGDLQKRYPFGGGTVYRGLHFTDAEQYQKFMKYINDGTMLVNDPTSWTTDLPTAKDFAKTKKSYFPTPELMAASRLTSDRGDYMSGFAGVVLKTTVGSGTGCDVSKSEFAKESEVILPSGTYNVEVEMELIPFHRQYDTDDKVNSLISSLESGDVKLDGKMKDYVIRSVLPKATKEQVDVLVKLIYPKFMSSDIEKQIQDSVKENTVLEHSFLDDNEPAIVVHLALPFSGAFVSKGTDELIKRGRELARVSIDAGISAIKELEKQDEFEDAIKIDIRGAESIKALGMESELAELTSVFKTNLSKKYHSMNSRENNRKLKTSDDIKKHAADLEKLLKSMIKVG